jgi:hypothetical protein
MSPNLFKKERKTIVSKNYHYMIVTTIRHKEREKERNVIDGSSMKRKFISRLQYFSCAQELKLILKENISFSSESTAEARATALLP